MVLTLLLSMERAAIYMEIVAAVVLAPPGCHLEMGVVYEGWCWVDGAGRLSISKTTECHVLLLIRSCFG